MSVLHHHLLLLEDKMIKHLYGIYQTKKFCLNVLVSHCIITLIHSFIHSSIYPSIHPFIHHTIYLFINPSVHSFIYPSFHTSIYTSIRPFLGHQDSVTCVKFSHDDKYVASSDLGGVVKARLCSNGKCVWNFETSPIEVHTRETS